MSFPAIIKLAPICRLEDLDELRRRGRTVYDFGTFRPLLPQTPIPVVVDHGEHEIGLVREFAYRAAPEGGAWCFAHCRLDEEPDWLRPGTPASFEAILRRSIDLGGIERVLRQRVTEVTVCSPSFSAVEPLARVEWIGARSRDLPAAVGPPPTSAVGEILPSPTGVIRRPSSGRVLGVR